MRTHENSCGVEREKFSNECTPDFGCCVPDLMTNDEDKRREEGWRKLMALADGDN